MYRLRDDLRAMFARQQGRVGHVSESRRRLVREAPSRRDEPMSRQAQLFAGIAAGAIALLVVGTFAHIRAGGHGTAFGSAASGAKTSPTNPPLNGKPLLNRPPSSSPEPMGGPIVIDVSDADTSHGWMLLTNCVQPMAVTCHFSVVATADGGSTWSKPVRVGGEFDPGNGDAPRHLEFISSQDGFVYGGTEAFVTHDAGLTWTGVSLHVPFFGYLVGHGDRVWLSVYPCVKGVACAYQLYSSADAGRTWSAPSSLPAGFAPSTAAALLDTGLVLEDMQTGAIELTLDGGVTWTAVKSRCAVDSLDSTIATSDGKEIWELCQSYPANNTGPATRTLFVSENVGASWSRVDTSLIGARLASRFWPWIIVSNRPGQVLLASSQTTIAMWRAGGHSWTDVGPAGVGFTAVKFAPDGFNGWAIDVNRTIWFTHDGGDAWKPMPGYHQ